MEEQICKLTNSKKENLQAKHSKPFIVWIDLQDDAFLRDEETVFNLNAVQVSNGYEQIEYLSSVIWYAMYGQKDMRIFQYSSTKEDYDKRKIEDTVMQHDRKFFDENNNNAAVSAVIFSTLNNTFMALLSELDASSFDVTMTGFDAAEVDELLTLQLKMYIIKIGIDKQIKW